MIVVDASALLAIYLSEPERDQFTALLRNSARNVMSPVNYWEALVRAIAVNGAGGKDEIANLALNLEIVVVSIDIEIAQRAADAFTTFGKRAKGKLNLGDCFAYALAKQQGAPLLYRGDDFVKTDIVAA